MQVQQGSSGPNLSRINHSLPKQALTSLSPNATRRVIIDIRSSYFIEWSISRGRPLHLIQGTPFGSLSRDHEETLRDTLEGITDLHEMIAAIIRSALVDEALQAGLRTRIEDMRQRLTRLAERGLKKRQLALEAMNEAGLKKLEQPDFTASARVGAPPLGVTSEQSVPEGYWIPQPPKLDGQALISDLRGGDEIPGACLSNAAPILTVRTK